MAARTAFVYRATADFFDPSQGKASHWHDDVA